MSDTRRIAKNTLMLYFRQILIMLVSLYTVRVVLSVLGAEDYGIYNVVAGVVTMFGFLGGAMATASQRYFSFDLGKGDAEHLQKIFSLTLIIYFLFILAVILVAESLGAWFVARKLNVAQERIATAQWVYQFSVLSFAFTVMTAPFMADIIAHEDMAIYAYVSIAEVLLKLAVVFSLKRFNADRLFLYGLLMLFVTVVNTTIYRTVCRVRYKECRFTFYWNHTEAKEMICFVGWNLFGSAAPVAKKQVVNIMLNQYFNPVVNAARAVSNQVYTAVSSFSHNFSTALRPSIIKSYSARNIDEMLRLVFYGCKLTYFLMWIFTLPLVMEMNFVLQLWLSVVPDHTVLFTRLTLLDGLITSISFPIMCISQATGKVRLYQGVVGGLQLLNMPLAWLVLALGMPAESVLIVAAVISVIANLLRLVISHMLVRFSLRAFLWQVIIPISVVSFASFVPSFLIHRLIAKSMLGCISSICISVLIVCALILFAGCTKTEREKICSTVVNKLHFIGISGRSA